MTVHERNISASIDPVKLDRLAEVAIKVGLQLQPGQDLLLTAPTVALPLVRRIAEHAYKAGAGLVTPILSDEAVTLSRYRFGPDDSFDRAAGWLYEGCRRRSPPTPRGSPSSATIRCCCPARTPPRSRAPARPIRSPIKPALEKIVNFDINWNIIAYPSPAWAKQVFPDDEEDVAVAKLADAIFAASRVDNDDAVAAWEKHNAMLRERTEWLNGQRFHALHYSGPGTDLTIGLADGHEWEGGASTAKNGITCNANIPTEEVFTTPHAPAGQRACRQHQAAVLSGLADRRHRGAVRGRTHRRGQGQRAARKC